MTTQDTIAQDSKDGPLAGQKLGFVGLGLMGRPMTRLLAGAGADLTVTSRSQGPVNDAVRLAMKAAAGPAEVAAAADIIILMLTDTASVQAVAAELIKALKPGQLVIDMGTTAVAATRELAEQTRQTGADWLDAPVSGGTVAAEAGKLTIMAGGSSASFDRALPIFQVLGQRITYVGDSGAGQVAKCANQVIVGLTIGAVSEALALARAAGVDPAKVRDAIRGGFAESRILDLHGGRMVSGDFTPGARATVQLKDLRQAEELAEQSDVNLPTVGLTTELFEMLVERGDGGLDHAALYRLYTEPDGKDDGL